MAADEDMDTSVRVALRIRPQIPRELIDMCRMCTQVTPGEPQVVLGADKAFTFDFVFDISSMQAEIYSACVEKLVDGALKGYNATVLAYGQTGSGKTYTMGTGFDRDVQEDCKGIIPRAVRHLFAGIDTLQKEPYDDNGVCLGTIQFSVAAQFMELYNEEIIDLLDPYNKAKVYKIHEDSTGGISVSGATIKPITGPGDALRCLQQGALARTTASTQMNQLSSRSHALFTILIRRQRMLSAEECGMPEGDLETLTSKFHFVDLAGSERLKRTGATGERAREGISINCGLLSLGNVISALGDKSKKASHVPYRDSKLTRLLQDSLGGNSQTLMIACISPSDRDFMETLNTLKYANRARNIKNRVQINQDQSSRTISSLRREIAALQLELLEYKQGKRSVDADGNAALSDTFYENTMLLADNKRMQQRLKAMQETINAVTEKNVKLLTEQAAVDWNSAGTDKSVTDLIGGYMTEIEKLQSRLIESDQMYQQLKKQQNSPRNLKNSTSTVDETEIVIDSAKRVLEKERELLMSRSLPGFTDVTTSSSVASTTDICSTTTSTEGNGNGDNNSDTDSDSDSEEKADEMQAELNDISSDIELKTKLIEQLELSQQRMQVMRQHYEEKLNLLNAKIINTQKERDQVLANMGASGSGVGSTPTNDKIKKVREEYERKLSDMQRELRKLQHAQKEHIRQQRELQAQDSQLRNLKNELFELKSAKIKLMRKMNEDNNRHKEEEKCRNREISKLRKESRKQLNTIKSLQAQTAAKDQILKRRNEQVTALRKGQRSYLSVKAAGRVPVKANTPPMFSVRQARIKWETVLRTINKAARSKQAIVELERELERLLLERESLSKDLANVKKRQKQQPPTSSIGIDLAYDEDTLSANLNYIQENISHIQHSIMELDEGKETTSEPQAIRNMVEDVDTLEEAKFLLEKLCSTAIVQTCDIALKQTRLLERDAILNEVQQDSSMQQQILQHVLSQNPTLSDNFSSGGGDTNGGGGGGGNSNYNPSGGGSIMTNTWTMSTIPADPSANEFDAITESCRALQSLISSRSTSPLPSCQDSDSTSSSKTPKSKRKNILLQDILDNSDKNDMTKSFSQSEGGRSFIPLSRVPSAPGSLKGLLPVPILNRQFLKKSPSPLFSRKSYDVSSTLSSSSATTPTITTVLPPFATPSSPRFIRRTLSNKTASSVLEDEYSGMKSPQSFRRMLSREENSDVFSRLGAGIQDPAPGGTIRMANEKPKSGSPLQCTHIMEGHTSSVQSIQVHENTLFTAAADRTVRIWDIAKTNGPIGLISHPGPVVSIVYDKLSNLLFSACGAYVKAWDSRTSYTKAVKTLCSSGTVIPGQTTVGLLQTGENAITALCVGASGNLYTAASDKVRIWDLRQLSCLGKLSGGHQAAVMCVTAWKGQNNTDFVATGSKDHYVKVFEVTSNGGLVLPLLHLEPPHYDGVQSLVVTNNALGADASLFSGSRDSGIKRWNLRNGELKQSINNAHKGWVSGMTISDNILLTSCRAGIIRLWNVDTFESVAELKTDSSINDIVASDSLVYTASSSGEVRIWRFATPKYLYN